MDIDELYCSVYICSVDNKTKLRHEAQRLFARKGVDAVGVQEIVVACGVTKPTLYHYFGSKDGLLQAIVDEGYRVLEESLDHVGDYHYDLPGYLEQMALAWLKCVRGQPDFFRLALSLLFLPENHPGHKMTKKGQLALQHRMEALFVVVAKDHGNMRGRQKYLAASWLGALNNWASIYLGGWGDPEGEFLKMGLRQYLYGVFS